MAKNKMKSHRGACKRMKLTGSGKVKRNKAYKIRALAFVLFIVESGQFSVRMEQWS